MLLWTWGVWYCWNIIHDAIYNWVWLHIQVLLLSLLFWKCEVTHKSVPLFALKAYWRSGGMAPVILNFNMRWGWVDSFTLQPIYPWYPLSRRLVGLHNVLWPHWRKFKTLFPWGIKLQFHYIQLIVQTVNINICFMLSVATFIQSSWWPVTGFLSHWPEVNPKSFHEEFVDLSQCCNSVQVVSFHQYSIHIQPTPSLYNLGN